MSAAASRYCQTHAHQALPAQLVGGRHYTTLMATTIPSYWNRWRGNRGGGAEEAAVTPPVSKIYGANIILTPECYKTCQA